MSSKRRSDGLGSTRSWGALGGLFLLGATLAVLGTAAPFAPGTEVPATGTVDRSSVGTAELHALRFFDLTGHETVETDRPTCMGLPASPGGVGTDGDDVITGTPGKDVIVAGGGNDVVDGRDGRDVICGGPGEDRLVGGRSFYDEGGRHFLGDRLLGGAGDDRIIDRYGTGDRLIGGSGNDHLTSYGGYYRVVKGGPGADRLTSELGWDENVRGGPGGDTLTSLSGGGISRRYAGGSGRDVITVGGHGDISIGLTVDGDHLAVHGYAYVLISFWTSPKPVAVDLTAGTIRHIGAPPTAPPDVITHVGRKSPSFLVYGSNGDDHMTSPDARNPYGSSLDGRAGNDTLIGNGGLDFLRGDQGDDTIYGGYNNDGLYGGPGNDLLDGGPGDDSTDGGPGTDTCLNAEYVQGCSP